MGEKSQKLPENRNLGGRDPLPLCINWHSRAKQIWKRFPKTHKKLGTLISAAAAASTEVIGSEHAARAKLNGKRTASDAFAKVMFDATGFKALGLTLGDWIGDDAGWERAVAELSDIDPRAMLDGLAESGSLGLGIDSTPELVPARLRRAGSGPPPEQRAFLNEYFVLHVRYAGSEPISPAHLLLLEWSDATSDWQVFNALPGCRLDPHRSYDLTPEKDVTGAKIHLGIRVAPPRDEFDLYLLAQRSEFDHRALAIISALDGNALMSQREMAKLLALLTQPDRGLLVAKLRYAVQ